MACLLLLLVYFAAGYLTPRVHWITSRPPTPRVELSAVGPRTASGVLHVHTGRSHDAVGTDLEVARAAHAAGLDFVILTEHLDPEDTVGYWQPSAAYLDSVLIVRGQESSLGVEIGRVLTVGLDTLVRHWAGDLEGFDRLLQRRGAVAVVAHPRSPRERDRWKPDRLPSRVVGWEVFDLSDVARARLRDPWVVYHLTALLVGWPIGRLDESLVRLYRDGFDGRSVAAFDSAFARGAVTGVAGLDAHPKTRFVGALLPGYTAYFQTLINHVRLTRPLPAEPEEAARILLNGIARGEVYVSFGTENAAGLAFELDRSPKPGTRWGPEGPHAGDTRLRIQAGFDDRAPDRLLYRVVRDGRGLEWVRGPTFRWSAERESGRYRLEIYRYGLRIGPLVWNLRPWIFTNPRSMEDSGPGAGAPVRPGL